MAPQENYIASPLYACMHGLCFLVAWKIHVSCNLLCAMCGIAMHGLATCVTAMQGTCLDRYFRDETSLPDCNAYCNFLLFQSLKLMINSISA